MQFLLHDRQQCALIIDREYLVSTSAEHCMPSTWTLTAGNNVYFLIRDKVVDDILSLDPFPRTIPCHMTQYITVIAPQLSLCSPDLLFSVVPSWPLLYFFYIFAPVWPTNTASHQWFYSTEAEISCMKYLNTCICKKNIDTIIHPECFKKNQKKQKKALKTVRTSIIVFTSVTFATIHNFMNDISFLFFLFILLLLF